MAGYAAGEMAARMGCVDGRRGVGRGRRGEGEEGGEDEREGECEGEGEGGEDVVGSVGEEG